MKMCFIVLGAQLSNKALQRPHDRSILFAAVKSTATSSAAELGRYIDALYLRPLFTLMLFVLTSSVFASDSFKRCDPTIKALEAPIPTMIPPTYYRPIPKSGSAQVEFIVHTDGSIADAIIIQPSELKLWDVSVIRTILKWKFPVSTASCKRKQKFTWVLE